MNITSTLTPSELPDFLLNIATVRPVFIWGPPGIGKSTLVEQFAHEVGLDCVSLLGTQLAPEDLIGVPQIISGKSRFCPPTTIARDEAYCLFLDELNACSHDVQKAFYSLIHDRRLGEYELPKGSIVIGAGNRAQDSAIVKPMSSALLNRMIHVQLKASHPDWLRWAGSNGIHPLVIEYVQTRPDHLWAQPPKTEEPYSTPRSWHMLSDGLHAYGERLDDHRIEMLASGCLSPHHAGQFRAFVKQTRSRFRLTAIMRGDIGWPSDPSERDVLYFLSQSFRAQLIKELPEKNEEMPHHSRDLAHRAKSLLKDLASINLEVAQMVVSESDGESLPYWFMVEVVRDLPRLVERKDG